MDGNRLDIFVSIAVFAILSIGIANASGLIATPNPYAFTPGNVLDIGQNTVASAIISNGIGPYTGNWVLTAPQSSNIPVTNTIVASLPSTTNALTLTINAISSNSLEFTFNGVSYYANAIGTNTIYGVWTITGNAEDSTSSNTVQVTNTLTIDPALSVSISPVSGNYDNGQTISITATPSGGTPSYSYQWYNDTSGTANAISGATSNTFSTPANSIPIKIILTNSQSIATNAPFQQIINISESSYPSLTYNSVFADFEYTYANGTVIPAWIESNNSGIITTWVKIAKGIPANSNITIYLNIKPGVNLLSNSGTTGIGEAPQLSPVYGEYDDGASVFNYYDNFAGTSLTGWVSNKGGLSSLYIYANNGLYINLNGTIKSQQNIYYSNAFATPFILEADLVSIFNNGGSSSITMSEGSSSSADLDAGGLLVGGYGFSFYSPTGSQLVYTTGTSGFSAVNAIPPISTPTIIGLSWSATGNENVFYNYRNVLYSTNNAVTLGPNNYIEFGFDSGASYTNGEFQWVRIRALPPNGVMPSVSFASQYKYYVVVTDSASTHTSATSSTGSYTVNPALSVSISPTSRTYDAGQAITLSASVSGGTPPYSYQWYNVTPSGAVAIRGATSPTYSATASATGTFKYYVVVKDSATALTSANSLAGTYIVNNALSVSISPKSRTYDAGQTISITATPSGGTPPYSYQWYNTTSFAMAIPGATSTTYNVIAFTITGHYDNEENYGILVKDSATNPTSIFSINGTYYVNPAPTLKLLTPSNTILDSGQYVTYNVTISGGTIPITANLIYLSGPSNTVINGNAPGNVLQTVTLAYYAAQSVIITFNSFELTTPGSYTFNVVAVDSANTPVTFNAVANTITVNPTLSVSISPTSNTLDVGQTLALTTNVIGGTPGFSIAYTGNDLCGSLSATSNTLSADGTNTIVFSPNTAITSACTANIMATVTDSATTNSIVSANSVITVNPTPTATSLTPSNTILDSEQYVTYNVVMNGGTLPITANLIYLGGTSNALINGNVPGNVLQTIILPAGSAEPNTITFNSFELTTPGSYTFNVIAVDSANAPVTFNAVANTITVDVAPYITLTATPSNSIMYGKPFTVNAVITGGTGNFAVYWYLNSNSITPTVVSTNAETSNTIALPAAGSYAYIVSANDIGTSSVYVVKPVANTVLVYKNDTLTATSTSHPATVYNGQPVSITFTGTPTINNQSAWSLYVNGVLYGKTASQITWSEYAAPVGTYSFVFNNTGNANYTAQSTTTALNIVYPPTGVTTPTPTTTVTTTVTTTIPTTIPPSGISMIQNISSTAPLKLNLASAETFILVTTPSTAPAPVKAFVSNITSTAPLAPTGFAMVSALNISINTTANVSITVTQGYPCSENASLIAPYLFKNGTWVAITPFTVNATACTVTYSIQKDPIVGILAKVPTTTTTVPTTTVPTTTIIPTTTIPPVVTPTPNYGWAIVVVIVIIIIIIAILYYYMSKGSKHRR